MSAHLCKHCGHPIEFMRVSPHREIAKDHPYRFEYETYGGWWIHSEGPAAYLRSCAFGPTLADCLDAYFKYRDAKATPKVAA